MSEAFDAVDWLLSQDEPEARRVAVQQLVKLSGHEAADLLVRALGDSDWRVRKETARTATLVEPREEIVAALTAALDERMNIGLRNAAVEALISIGPDAVPAAIDALTKLDADGRKLAVEILGGVPDLRGTRALTRVLGDEDANVRIAAAEALRNASLAGEEARELAASALADVLSTSETFLKLAALDALSHLNAKLPWSVFAPYAEDPVLRRYAIVAAAGSREPAALTALVSAISDAAPTVANEAIVGFGECVVAGADHPRSLTIATDLIRGSAGAQRRVRDNVRDASDTRSRGAGLLILGLLADANDIPLLVAALDDGDVAQRAELGLSLFGAPALPLLLEEAKIAHSALRASILSLIASFDVCHASEGREAFRDAIHDPSLDVASAAMKGLSATGNDDDLARVAPFVSHADARLAMLAATALAQIAARHPDESRAMLAMMDPRAPDAAVGCALVLALGQSETEAGESLLFLERAISHSDPRTRRAAVDALAVIGGDAASDTVVFALADEEREVQISAVRALGRLRRAEPLVHVVAAARDPELVVSALRALGEVDASLTFAAARPLVRHPDPAIACAAVESIARIGASELTASRLTPSTAPASTRPRPRVGSALDSSRPGAGVDARARENALFEALDHPDPEVVKMSLAELAEPGDPRVLARFGRCLDHGSWEVRRLAAELLGQYGSVGAQALLRGRYEREKDPLVRDAIAVAVSVRPPPDGFPTMTAPAPALAPEQPKS